jgi:MSHA biogenesis protein MshN
MSVINQMLIDLDRRRASGGERASLPHEVRPLPAAPPLADAPAPPASRLSLDLAAAPRELAREPAPRAPERAREVAPATAPGPAPADGRVMARSAPPAEQPVAGAGIASGAVVRTPAAPPPAPAVAAAPPPAAAPQSPVAPATANAPAAVPSLVFAAPAAAPVAAPAPAPRPAAVVPAAAPETAAPPRIERQERELTAAQRSENALRRALDALAAGRNGEAEALLREALAQYTGNETARQILFGLLVDLRRGAEAEQVLHDGLRVNPQQAGFAMALARFQVERGDLAAAIETLNRTLPAARDRAEYIAFLAAVQQRAGRHAEAIASYQAALRLAPHNGVWWMGLGISLEGDGRGGDAAEAFRRARESGSLGTELTAFVDQRLKRLQGR